MTKAIGFCAGATIAAAMYCTTVAGLFDRLETPPSPMSAATSDAPPAIAYELDLGTRLCRGSSSFSHEFLLKPEELELLLKEKLAVMLSKPCCMAMSMPQTPDDPPVVRLEIRNVSPFGPTRWFATLSSGVDRRLTASFAIRGDFLAEASWQGWTALAG